MLLCSGMFYVHICLTCPSPLTDTSPEMLTGQDYNEQTDVFSFGVVLWELLTRRDPPERRPSLGYSIEPSFFGIHTSTTHALKQTLICTSTCTRNTQKHHTVAKPLLCLCVSTYFTLLSGGLFFHRRDAGGLPAAAVSNR